MPIAPIKKLFDTAELMTEVKSVFSKIDTMSEAQKSMMAVIEKQDERIRELESRLREISSEVRLDALRETQQIVNSVNGKLVDDIKDLTVQLDRLCRRDENANLPLLDAAGSVEAKMLEVDPSHQD